MSTSDRAETSFRYGVRIGLSDFHGVYLGIGGEEENARVDQVASNNTAGYTRDLTGRSQLRWS
jgi:hypothetical protein